MKIVAALIVASLAAAQQEVPPVFRGGAHATSVDVAVFDGDRVVTSLGRSDFRVVDNGLEQTLEAADHNKLPIDLKLVFDTSGSITPEGLERYRKAMRRVADTLLPGDRCEIISFTTRVTDAAARQSPPIAIDLQRGLPEGTAFFDAVSLALVTVPATDRRQIVIVLSDAQDNSSFFDEAALIDAAKNTGAVVYPVLPAGTMATAAPFVARLQSLALLTGGRLVPAYHEGQIASAIIDAINEFRNSYILRYTVRGAKPGWHTLGVKVPGARYTIRARSGYFI